MRSFLDISIELVRMRTKKQCSSLMPALYLDAIAQGKKRIASLEDIYTTFATLGTSTIPSCDHDNGIFPFRTCDDVVPIYDTLDPPSSPRTKWWIILLTCSSDIAGRYCVHRSTALVCVLPHMITLKRTVPTGLIPSATGTQCLRSSQLETSPTT